MLAPGVQLPAVVGASAPYQNTADMRTRGWELSLNWRDIRIVDNPGSRFIADTHCRSESIRIHILVGRIED